MKVDLTLKLFFTIYNKEAKKQIKDKDVLKNIKNEYISIMKRASDIGNGNKLISSYAMAAYFIALNRKDGLTTDRNYEILKEDLLESKLLKIALGDAKTYLSEKKMVGRRKWAKESLKKKYKNDWVLNIVEKDDKYVFGIDYLECGVCKLCRDENCFELAKYLCKLDFMLADLIGVKLHRTKTLAEGGNCCDFRYTKE